MSYSVRHFSATKNAWLSIETMSAPHIMNAWRKLRDAHADPLTGTLSLSSDDGERMIAFTQELQLRGWTFNHAEDRWETSAAKEARI